MTIQQERDIAVRALEEISAEWIECNKGRSIAGIMRTTAQDGLDAIKREQALQSLTDQAQELDMGYGAAQASPKAPSKLGQQVARAQAEMATWTNEQRASVRLSGGDHVEQASPVAQDVISQFEEWAKKEYPEDYAIFPTIMFAKNKKGQYEGMLVANAFPAYLAGRASVAVPAAQPVGEAADINEVPHLIFFDDRDRPPELLIGRERALLRYAQISTSWNAHLFFKIDSNSRDCRYPSATPSAPPVAQDRDAARYRWLRDSKSSGAAIRAIYEDGQTCPSDVDELIDAAMQAEVKSS